MSFPVVGTIRSFEDTRKAFERVRAYFLSGEAGNVVAPETSVQDSGLALFDGTTGKKLKAIGNQGSGLIGSKPNGTYVSYSIGNMTATPPIHMNYTRQVIGGDLVVSHLASSGYIHLPAEGVINQILKSSGVAGAGAWGTVTENLGALAAITTIGMSGQLTNTLADGTAPFVVTSTTLVSNLNSEHWNSKHLGSVSNGKLVRYNSTGTLIETGTVAESAGALSAITTIGMSGQLTNGLAIGTAPFAVTSTTLNTNLNADLWDGYHFSDLMSALIGRIVCYDDDVVCYDDSIVYY